MKPATPETQIRPQSTLKEVLHAYPGAQRALFRKYHIGGCSSCGFSQEETLEQLCSRNGNLNVYEVMDHIYTSHEQDQTLLITCGELKKRIDQDPQSVRLLDVRTREEYDAVKIPGAIYMNQDVAQEMLSKWARDTFIVVYDHLGENAIDAAAYFQGHGFTQTLGLIGGIDAWSQEVDPQIRRYEMREHHE